jgi:hypothetical protein
MARMGTVFSRAVLAGLGVTAAYLFPSPARTIHPRQIPPFGDWANSARARSVSDTHPT